MSDQGGIIYMIDMIEFIITNLISLGASSLESPSKNGCYQEDVRANAIGYEYLALQKKDRWLHE